MAVACPSLPPKILTPEVTDARLRRLDRHTLGMAADGCHLGACSLWVLLVNIKSFSSWRAIQVIAQPSLYKTERRSCQELSPKKQFANLSLAVASIILTTNKLPTLFELAARESRACLLAMTGCYARCDRRADMPSRFRT